jgi:hypothetical protein
MPVRHSFDHSGNSNGFDYHANAKAQKPKDRSNKGTAYRPSLFRRGEGGEAEDEPPKLPVNIFLLFANM